jgi:hypothetical protein
MPKRESRGMNHNDDNNEKENTMTEIRHLTTLHYSQPQKGADHRFYLYDADGFHTGGIWFTSGTIQYPGEEITVDEARERVTAHLAKGLEVRITNWQDFLVFHAIGDHTLYGSDDFWSQL